MEGHWEHQPYSRTGPKPGAWIFTPVFCFVSILFVFYLINFFLFSFLSVLILLLLLFQDVWGVAFSFWGRERTWNWVGTEVGKIFEELGVGKEHDQIHCMKIFQLKMLLKCGLWWAGEAVSWQDVCTSPWVQYSAWTGHGDTQINPVFKRPKNLRSVA